MNERERTTQAATGALIVFAVLLLLVAGCQAVSEDDGDDGCEWFGLAAQAVPAAPPPRPAAPAPALRAPAPVRKAPSLEKQPAAPKSSATRRAVPAPTAAEAPAVQAPTVRKSPTPTKTSTKKPGHRRGGHGLDLCDD